MIRRLNIQTANDSSEHPKVGTNQVSLFYPGQPLPGDPDQNGNVSATTRYVLPGTQKLQGIRSEKITGTDSLVAYTTGPRKLYYDALRKNQLYPATALICYGPTQQADLSPMADRNIVCAVNIPDYQNSRPMSVSVFLVPTLIRIYKSEYGDDYVAEAGFDLADY